MKLVHLEVARKTKNITLADIADLFGYKYQTISDKINCVSDFKFEEAAIIRKKFFPEYDLEYLFEKIELKQTA